MKHVTNACRKCEHDRCAGKLKLRSKGEHLATVSCDCSCHKKKVAGEHKAKLKEEIAKKKAVERRKPKPAAKAKEASADEPVVRDVGKPAADSAANA